MKLTKSCIVERGEGAKGSFVIKISNLPSISQKTKVVISFG